MNVIFQRLNQKSIHNRAETNNISTLCMQNEEREIKNIFLIAHYTKFHILQTLDTTN